MGKEDLIGRQAAIDALWQALYEYEDKAEKQFQESEELDVEDWIQHRIFVQNMSDIDRQVIMNLPSAQMEEYTEERIKTHASDSISRQAALDCFHDWMDKYGDVHTADEMTEYWAIEELPAAQPERKKGKWEQIEVNYLADMDDDIKESIAIASMFCPQCKRYHNKVYLYGEPTYGVNFCPNCGADMRGGEE